MNFKSLFFAVVFMIPGVFCQAQDNYQYVNAFRLGPIEFGQSEFQFSYERYFKDRKSSLVVTPSIFLKDEGGQSFKGVQAMLQYRLYLSHLLKDRDKTLGMHNIGFYAGPYLLGMWYTEDYTLSFWDPVRMEPIFERYNKDINAYEGGAVMGVQIDLTQRVVIDLFVGGGIRYADVKDEYDPGENSEYQFYYDVFDKEYTGVKPKLGLQIGITF